MSDLHPCSVCGTPTTRFVVETVESRDDTGEIHAQPEPQSGKRYFCDQHLPRLHSEPLEDRIE
jgi:hypothetical protein